jgi:HEAT repeat protein
MRLIVTSAAAFVFLSSVSFAVSSAFAHGGSYVPPFGNVPDGSRDPSDPPPPPPTGAGPQTPSGEPGAQPTTGGPDANGPQTPGGGGTGPSTGSGPSGGPPTGGGGGGASPSTGGRAPGAKQPGYADWPFWWGYNKDEFLKVKAAVRGIQRGPLSGARGKKTGVGAIVSLTDEAVQERIVPALRALLADEKQIFHIRSAAELALAKIGDTTIIPTLEQMARAEPAKVHREIRESAALSLGLLQVRDPAVRTFLGDIVRDDTMSGSYTRPFAAVSLGLLPSEPADPAATSALLAGASRKEASSDTRTACLVALGLEGDVAAIPELIAMARTGKATAPGAEPLSPLEVSYAVAALGKIGRPGSAAPGDETIAVDFVLRVVGADHAKFGANERRSAAIALGEIGPNCPPKSQHKVADALRSIVEDEQDEQERNFATMSLGRLAASQDADPAVRKDAIAVLGRSLEKGHGVSQQFAALALGVIGRAYTDNGVPADEEGIRAPLRRHFAEGGPARARGAYAVALGLAKDPLAVPDLLAALKDVKEDKRLRSYCALSLGMIGAREAAETIRATLKDELDRDLRTHCAMAAGLLGDSTAVEGVLAVLQSGDASTYEVSSAAAALGQIGDERAADALVAIAVDKAGRYPDISRAMAVVALGQIGDRRDVPLLSRLSQDVNYRAQVPAITELLSIQ